MFENSKANTSFVFVCVDYKQNAFEYNNTTNNKHNNHNNNKNNGTTTIVTIMVGNEQNKNTNGNKHISMTLQCQTVPTTVNATTVGATMVVTI